MNYVTTLSLLARREALRPLPLLRRLRRLRLFAGAGQAHEDLRVVGALDLASDSRGARFREGPLVDGLEAAAVAREIEGSDEAQILMRLPGTGKKPKPAKKRKRSKGFSSRKKP